jgi:hypothetical protein
MHALMCEPWRARRNPVHGRQFPATAVSLRAPEPRLVETPRSNAAACLYRTAFSRGAATALTGSPGVLPGLSFAERLRRWPRPEAEVDPNCSSRRKGCQVSLAEVCRRASHEHGDASLAARLHWPRSNCRAPNEPNELPASHGCAMLQTQHRSGSIRGSGRGVVTRAKTIAASASGKWVQATDVPTLLCSRCGPCAEAI